MTFVLRIIAALALVLSTINRDAAQSNRPISGVIALVQAVYLSHILMIADKTWTHCRYW